MEPTNSYYSLRPGLKTLNRKPRLLIVDPNLKEEHGHYLSYATRIADSAKCLGITPIIIANHEAMVSTQQVLKPMLHQTYWQEMIPAPSENPYEHLASSVRMFANAMRDILIKIEADANDVLFLPYANIVEAQAIALLSNFMDSILPRTVFLFRREIEEQAANTSLGLRAIITLLRSSIATIKSSATGSRVRILTDSDQLTSDYEEVFGNCVQTAPIPVDPKIFAFNRHGSSTRTLLYLGDARTEKGYQMLPALAAFLSESLGSGILRLVIQSNFNIAAGEPGISEARAILSAQKGIELLYEPLSEEEYAHQLSVSTLLLLPYQRSNYVARSSGILAEAIVAGIPAIVPSGTWLSQQLRRFGGGLCFDGSSEGLIHSVSNALRQIDALQQQAKDRHASFAEFHNPTRLAKFICGADVLRIAAAFSLKQNPISPIQEFPA